MCSFELCPQLYKAMRHTFVLCVFPSGSGGLLQHPEGVWFPLREERAHLCEGERRAAHLFSEGKRQTRLIYQRLLCHSATSGGG